MNQTIRILLAFAVFVGAAASYDVAQAATCNDRAAQLVRETGGQILSIETRGDNCRIRIALPTRSGPPRSKLFVVRK